MILGPGRHHKALYKKVRSERCFATHLLSVSCAVFRQVVRRDGLKVGERLLHMLKC